MLAGEPTLRTPDGERRLRPGDVVSFPRGPQGAHKLADETSEPARYRVFSTKRSIDIVEYSDSRKVGLGSRGAPWRILGDGPSLDYREGE